MKEPQPTLEVLTQAVVILWQKLTQAVTAGLVEQAHRALMEQRTTACPQCGHLLSARGPAERTVETLVGRFGSGAPTFTATAVSWGPLPWTRRWS
jgi:hypothetical protein